MENRNYYKSVLLELIDCADKIEAEWNGDIPGIKEDNARIASNMRTKILELVKLINELR